MPKKKKVKDEDDDIPTFSQYEYSHMLTAFAESDKLLETELNTLICYRDYQLKAPLNSFNNHKLNDHLYVIFGTKQRETVEFMRQWVGFFVHQH